jgi:hypothetical protein
MIPNPDHVLDRLDAYLHRTLSAGEAMAAEEHCRECPSCRAAMEQRSGERRNSPGRTEGFLDAPARSSRHHLSVMGPVFLGFWLVVGSAAVLLAGFHLYYATLEPSPYDLRVLG